MEYDITYDSLGNYSKEINKEIKKAYKLTQNINSNKTINIIEKLIVKYPAVPEFYNYLFIIYTKNNQDESAYEIIKETLEKFPDYLFAKLNMAQICIDKKRYLEIPKLFNNKYDLKMLYPKRDVFHIIEIISFYYIMSQYFININQKENAEMFFSMMTQLDPENLMTKHIEILL